MRLVVAILGFALVVGVFVGMVDTLISTRLRTARRRRFSTWLPSMVWPAFRALGRIVKGEHRRETILSSYPPLLLLAMLAWWVGFQIVGWAMVWWGSGIVAGVTSFVDALYYSGVVYFTVGFSDIVPTEGFAQALTMAEAFSGVVFIALTVGYLPSLYSAFSERERLLLRLDDGSEQRITPMSLMLAELDGSTDLDDLDDVFVEWEAWVAMVLESHTSHNLLAWFRSQHPGQSWVTAMGLMGDVAVSVLALQGRRSGPAWRLYRRIVRTLDVVAAACGVHAEHVDTITREQFQWALEAWPEQGFDVPDDPEAVWREFRDLRRAFGGNLEALIDHLDAPRGFWGHQVGEAGTGAGATVHVGREPEERP